MDLIKQVNSGSKNEKWAIASCVHMAELYAGTAQDLDAETRATRGNASDMWCADCWRTMAHWLVDHPNCSNAEADSQWDIICDRPEGQIHRKSVSITFLAV